MNEQTTQRPAATVSWRTNIKGSPLRSKLATPKLLDCELYLAGLARTADRYPRQKNIQGLYFFSRTREHVWHESQLEAQVLKWLDMSKDIVAIAAQPLIIDFADGTSHIPDMLALHADHRQVVYDVKPRKFIAKFEKQFANTRTFCDQVGFGYEVYHETPRQVEINLNWLAGFKDPGYAPTRAETERLLQALGDAIVLDSAAAHLHPGDLPRGRAALFHLVWTNVLTFDLTQPISSDTRIERTSR
jgi:hypothetical protein